jgi:WLM domain
MFAYTMIGAVGAAAAYAFVKGERSEVEYVRSNVDQRTYLVQKIQKGGATSMQAADALGKIVTDIEALIRHLKEKYPKDERVILIDKRFDPAAISEGSSHTGYTSYSVNKGESVVLCLRQEDDSFAPPNVVMYVALHELSHLGTKEVGHPPSFWSTFSFILKEAVAIGIYKKQDFAKEPQAFCGITVDSSVI